MNTPRLKCLLLALVLPLVLTGCDEQWCKGEYGLIRPDECEGPPPGPQIDFEPNSATPAELDVKRNGSVLGVVVNDVSIWDNSPCKLRYDFIGLRKMLLDFDPVVGPAQPATLVTMESDPDDDGTNDVRIEIRLVDATVIRWNFVDLSGTLKDCDPLPDFGAGPNDPLPKEFLHIKKATLLNQIGANGNSAHLQVEVP
jgi:hypothetical protein